MQPHILDISRFDARKAFGDTRSSFYARILLRDQARCCTGIQTPAVIHVGNELGLETVISLTPPDSSQAVIAGTDAEVSGYCNGIADI